MKSGVLIAAAAASLAFVAGASAQTGVSGQPGIPSALVTTPDASASPTPVIPAPPVIPSRPSQTPQTPQTSAPSPAAPAPPPPAAPAAPPAHATPLAPLAPPPPPAPETPPAGKGEKRTGASFYTPYLSANDVLDKAILDLTSEVKAHPDDPGLRNDLGNLLARRGFAREAVDQYQKAAKLDHTFFLADYNEGLLWEKEGKPSSAIKAYERSIARKPGFPLSRFHLGHLYEMEGKSEAAIEEYAKALRIDPSLRWPARNPLVVQSRLLYRASIQNYSRDLAGATLSEDPDFADRAVWERLHPQKPVDTGELESESEEAESEPVVAGAPAAAPIIGGKAAPAKPADARRQQLIERFRHGRTQRPAPAPPPQTVLEPQTPPAAVPAPPEDENAPNPAMQQPEEPPPPPPTR